MSDREDEKISKEEIDRWEKVDPKVRELILRNHGGSLRCAIQEVLSMDYRARFPEFPCLTCGNWKSEKVTMDDGICLISSDIPVERAITQPMHFCGMHTEIASRF